MQNLNNSTMEEVTELELSTIDGGEGGAWAAVGVGAATAITCLASGGLEFGPWGWAGCALGGALVGVGTYVL
jgi:hypothetical protein